MSISIQIMWCDEHPIISEKVGNLTPTRWTDQAPLERKMSKEPKGQRGSQQMTKRVKTNPRRRRLHTKNFQCREIHEAHSHCGIALFCFVFKG